MENLAYIEQYFEDQLSEEERRAFEQRCKQDEAFATQVKFYLYAQLTLRKEGHEATKKQLLQLPIQEPAASSNILSSRYRKYAWALAASILLFLVIKLWISTSEPVYSPLALYEQYKTEPYFPVVRDEQAPSVPDSWNQVIMLYNSAQYEQVLQEIDTFRTETYYDKLGKNNIEFIFGTSSLLADQPSKAIGSLKLVQADSQWYDQALWYLALAYLKTQETVKAEEILTSISQKPHHFKQKEAKAIIDALDHD